MRRNDNYSTLCLVKPVLLLIPLYIVLIFLLPANETVLNKYGIDSLEYNILLFLLIFPYMLVWLGAILAYARTQQYTNLIKKSSDSDDFGQIARGIKYIAIGLPVVAILSLCLNSIGNNIPELKAATIIIINYLSLAVPLLAYSAIRKGTHGLVERAKLHFTLNDMRKIMIVLVGIGVVYGYFTFSKLDLESLTSSDNPYYLPGWLMITTIVIPYLYAWFNGLVAAYELVLFSRKVQGVLYRQAVRWMASGMVAVVAGGIGLQYLRTVVPRTGILDINISVVYALIAYIALLIGFILICFGAMRLKRIEEV